MIKHISLLGVLALFTACTGTDKETGDTSADADTDTDTDTDTDIAFALGDNSGDTLGISGDCNDDQQLCIYRMTTTTPAGTLVLKVAETTAPDDTMWTEMHDAFVLETQNTDGSETYRLDLTYALVYSDQAPNESTLLNRTVLGTLSGLTWAYLAASADSMESDCVVTGEDPSYYACDCTEVAR